MRDHPLLQAGHRRIADLDGEVAARDHDAVGRVDDLLERRDRLGALDLGDQQRVPPAAGDAASWRAMYMSSLLFGNDTAR